MKAVKARKDAISGRSRASVEKTLRGLKKCTVYTGHARFRSAREISVGEAVLSADRIFINVGGRASSRGIAGIERVPYLTNSSMMDLDVIPPHLVIVGGSYVGLEFAQMFRRFGSDVTVVEMGPRLIQREDEDVSTAIHEILTSEGIAVRLNARCISVSGGGGRVTVVAECADGSPAVEGSHLLLAVGRRPNTDDLGLDAAGVSRDERGYVVVDDQLQTNVPGIWALGDCNGKGAFTHTSYNDFEIVAANLLDNGVSTRLRQDPGVCALYRPAARPGGHDGGGGPATGTCGAGRQAADDPRRPCDRERRNQRVDEDRRRREITGDPWRRRSRHRRRRSDPLRAGHDVREGAVSRASAGHAHPSDRVRAHSDAARRADPVAWPVPS